MAYQTQRLVMVGLGVEQHAPNHGEPRLDDGIHLRWQPDPAAGIPWHGYHLYRRAHKSPRPRCIAPLLKGWPLGPVGAHALATTIGTLSSDAELVLTDQFAVANVPEVDLDGRTWTDLTLLVPQYLAYRVDVTIGLRSVKPIAVTAYLGGQPLESRLVQGSSNVTVTVSLRLDAIDRIRCSGGPACLIDVCIYPAAKRVTSGWLPLKNFPAPMCLPVADAAYPCVSRPQTDQAAFEMARDRIRYGDPAALHPARFAELHGALHALVAGGMTQPLDDLFLAAIDPQVAQMLGLYWHDATAERDQPYDYLILADHVGPSTRSSAQVLVEALADNFASADAWIVSAVSWPGSPDVAAPHAVTVEPIDGTRAGLRWQVGSSPPATRGVAFHLWRAGLGVAASLPPPAPDSAFTLISRGQPFLRSEDDPAALPPLPYHATDRVPDEGWYSYRVHSIDLFGRHSPWSQPPATVSLLDKIAPPPPAIEAEALDPLDPTVIQDGAYTAWRAAHTTAIGLRVRWRWTPQQALQAPDLREFRIYLRPGATPPTPDPRDPLAYAERVHVVHYDAAVLITPAARFYDVLLPVAAALDLGLAPTAAAPIAYAWVAVTGADSRTHTADHPRWNGAPWGGRFGNEGRASAPARIHRVHRVAPPPPPPLAPPGDELRASPPDYHGRAYFSVRWYPQADAAVQIYRALDDTLFAIDHARRPYPPPSENDDSIFPPAAVEPDWNFSKRAAVLAELASLDALIGQPIAAVRAGYRALSPDARRILASLPGNAAAFALRTPAPLDAATPALADAAGLDDPSGYTPRPQLRRFVDALPGGGTSRYFYRLAAIDAAHNRSALAVAWPPVYVPVIARPPAPHEFTATPGDRQVALRWRQREAALVHRYQIFRTAEAASAAQVAAMTLIATVTPHDAAAPGGAFTWTDAAAPAAIPLHYRVVAVGDAPSPPSATRTAQAFDDRRPAPPTFAPAVPVADGVALHWELADPTHVPMLQRREAYDQAPWRSVSPWLPPGATTATDTARQGRSFIYRVRVRDSVGRLNRDSNELEV